MYLLTAFRFYSTQDARKALSLNGHELQGQRLRVQVCNSDINYGERSPKKNQQYNSGRQRKTSDITLPRTRNNTIADNLENQNAYSPQDARSGDFHHNPGVSIPVSEQAKQANSPASSPSKKSRKNKKRAGSKAGTPVQSNTPSTVDIETEAQASPKSKKEEEEQVVKPVDENKVGEVPQLDPPVANTGTEASNTGQLEMSEPISPTGGLPMPTPLEGSFDNVQEPAGPTLPHERPPSPRAEDPPKDSAPVVTPSSANEIPVPTDDNLTESSPAAEEKVADPLSTIPEEAVDLDTEEYLDKPAQPGQEPEVNTDIQDQAAEAEDNVNADQVVSPIPSPATVMTTPPRKPGPAKTESLNPFAAINKAKKAEAAAKKKEKKKAQRVASNSKSIQGLSDITNRAGSSASEHASEKKTAKAAAQQTETVESKSSFLGLAEAGLVGGELEPPFQNSASVKLSDIRHNSDRRRPLPEGQSSPEKGLLSNMADKVFGFDFVYPISASTLAPDQFRSTQLALGPKASQPQTPGTRHVSNQSLISNTSSAAEYSGDSPDSVQEVTNHAPGAFPARRPMSSAKKKRLKRTMQDTLDVQRNDDQQTSLPSAKLRDSEGPALPLKNELNEVHISETGDDVTSGSPESPSVATKIIKAIRKSPGVIEAPAPRRSKKKKKHVVHSSPASDSSGLHMSEHTSVSLASGSSVVRETQEQARSNLVRAVTEYEYINTMNSMLAIGEKQIALDLAVSLGRFRGWREEHVASAHTQPYTLAVAQYSDESSRYLLIKSLSGEIKRLSQVAGVNARDYIEMQKEAEQLIKAEVCSVKQFPGLSEDNVRDQAICERELMAQISEKERHDREQMQKMLSTLNVIKMREHSPHEWSIHLSESVAESLPSGGYRGLGLGEETLPVPKRILPRQHAAGFVEEGELSSEEQLESPQMNDHDQADDVDSAQKPTSDLRVRSDSLRSIDTA